MKKILTSNHRFRQLGFSMMVTRMRGNYAKSPSQSELKACTDEMNAFLEKYGATMKDDYAVIETM